ncbi:flagellin [bacterium AH-315-I18]|nr:flagellin [Phycisphaeraceae bacterium]MBN4060958.1 flagellin [bacterium AH-315-I18]
MSRINTNVTSLLSQRILKQNNSALNTSLERLSTGLAINRGSDDPAGLIASENLRSEKASINAAIGNAERADQVMNIAEGGLQEVSSLLLEVQSLIGETANDAGLSKEEKEANQLQVDSILQTIDRIASSTSFQGAKLLNGTFDFTVSGQAATVSDFTINAAKLSHNENRDIEVVITASAQHAGLFVSTTGTLDLTNATSTFTFEVGGSKGSREFSFASGTTLASIADAVNTFKEVTGVSASTSGTGLIIKSSEYGSDEFVSFDIVSTGGQAGGVYTLSSIDEDVATTGSATTFANVTSPIRDTGQDVGAIINGVTATTDGRTAKIATDFLDMEIELTAAGATALSTISAMTITGGGAKFNLGPNVDINNQVSIGLGNVASRRLGNINIGFLDDLGSGSSSNLVDGDLETAQKIVNSAISQVSSLRGKIGAFQSNVVGTTIRSLSVALENTSAAESSIRDTDFASETAALTRAQILSQASTNILSIANSQPQSALALLG